MESAGDCGRGFSGTAGGVNASSLESDVDSGDIGREGWEPLIPLASADSLSPIPKDALRGRIEGESSLATT